ANPAGYHWFNLILHAVNIGLVYALGLAIFEWIPGAFLLAAVWGLHPVQTEAVTNIVGRSDMLAAFSVLSVLLLYRKFVVASGLRRAGLVALIALLVTIGMFSKESAIVVIAAVALYDLAYGQPYSWRSRWPAYVAILVPCITFLFVRTRIFAGA